jgi:hypothetical protein
MEQTKTEADRKDYLIIYTCDHLWAKYYFYEEDSYSKEIEYFYKVILVNICHLVEGKSPLLAKCITKAVTWLLFSHACLLKYS